MKKVESFVDAAGEAHNTAESATVSDLTALLVEEKFPRGAAQDLATKIFTHRQTIERIFREYDEAIRPS